MGSGLTLTSDDLHPCWGLRSQFTSLMGLPTSCTIRHPKQCTCYEIMTQHCGPVRLPMLSSFCPSTISYQDQQAT